MCFSSKPKPIPRQLPAPDPNNASSVQRRQRQQSSEQQGVFSNIFTSFLGDSGYGKSVKAAG